MERAAGLVGGADVAEELRRLSIELYRLAADHARERGIILADTKFEFGRDPEGRIVIGDEVLHAGLVALLAGRRLRARALAAVVRQAVRARLGRRLRLGQEPAGARAARRRRRAAPAARYIEAYERIAGEPFDAWLARSGAPGREGARAHRPKEGILDPQGQAVQRALAALGFEGVGEVHVGRLVELEVEDHSRVPEMCDRLLTNPLIEDYDIQIVGVEEART